MNQRTEKCSIPCNLCGGSDGAVLSYRSRSGRPLRTVICTSCGLVWSDPRPHDTRRFYEEEYRLSYKNSYAPKPKHVLRAGKVALSRFEKITQLLQSRKAVLDVGTGGGEFAYLLRSLGHGVNGIEPNKGYANYAVREYELTVHVGFVQESVFPPDSFDVVTMWHVLEHTEDPGAVLAQLRSWLKPDGMLVIEVPNVEATCQSPTSTFHEAHLYNFNVVSLRRLARKHGLYESTHIISPDGGNITMCLTRQEPLIVEPCQTSIPGNCEWVSKIVRGHSNLKRHMTAAPYVRAWQRLRRSLAERRETSGEVSGRELLDRLYLPQINAHSVTDPSLANR